MTKVPAKLRLGKKLEGDANEVQKQLDNMYLDIAPVLNQKADMVITDRAPTAQDDNNSVASFWLDTSVPNLYILTDETPTWTVII